MRASSHVPVRRQREARRRINRLDQPRNRPACRKTLRPSRKGRPRIRFGARPGRGVLMSAQRPQVQRSPQPALQKPPGVFFPHCQMPLNISPAHSHRQEAVYVVPKSLGSFQLRRQMSPTASRNGRSEVGSRQAILLRVSLTCARSRKDIPAPTFARAQKSSKRN